MDLPVGFQPYVIKYNKLLKFHNHISGRIVAPLFLNDSYRYKVKQNYADISSVNITLHLFMS